MGVLSPLSMTVGRQDVGSRSDYVDEEGTDHAILVGLEPLLSDDLYGSRKLSGGTIYMHTLNAPFRGHLLARTFFRPARSARRPSCPHPRTA